MSSLEIRAVHFVGICGTAMALATALNFPEGQVTELSKGKANPAVVGEILERKLNG